MKKIITFTFVLVSFLVLYSCEKERKLYDDVPQVAFALKTYSFNVSSTTSSVTIPVQLIAKEPQGAINATVGVNLETNCSSAVSVPATITIDAGRFIANLVIGVTHANLNAGNGNRLVLDLAASNIKVAGNYKTVTITLNKQ